MQLVYVVSIDYGHALSPGLKPSSLAWELAAQGHTGHVGMHTLCQLILLLSHHSSFCLHTWDYLSVGKITWQGKGNLTWHEDLDASLEHTKEAVQGCPLILDLGMQWHISSLASKDALFRSRCQWHESEYVGFLFPFVWRCGWKSETTPADCQIWIKLLGMGKKVGRRNLLLLLPMFYLWHSSIW